MRPLTVQRETRFFGWSAVAVMELALTAWRQGQRRL